MSVARVERFPGGAGCSCRAADRQAVRYFFNGLPNGRRAALQAHLRLCSRCRGKLAIFRQVWIQDRQRRQDLSGSG